MSELLTIVCPHCAYTKNIAQNAIPAGVRQATCPACKQPFSLNAETMRRQVEQAAATPPPTAPVAFVVTERPTPRTLGFAFTGTAGDYFGIWIVNNLLKMVTAGFYSAWAKVRKRRFFYGSTTLNDQPFEYLADPMALFKGWLIAAVAFVLYGVGSKVSPILSMVIALIVFLAFPWLVVRSRMFNAANTSYRNIRFSFRPDYQEAYLVYAALPFVSMLSMGILFPYTLYRQKKFVVENSSYGSAQFSFSATARDFYMISLRVGLGLIAIVVLIGGAIALAGFGFKSGGGKAALAIVLALSLPLIYFLLMVYGQTAMANLGWNSTALGTSRFKSSLRTRDMALLFVTNAVAILCSLGLLMPWATVRLLRYRFAQLHLETLDGLDGVVVAAGSGVSVGAAGEEIGDLFDMPVEIAL